MYSNTIVQIINCFALISSEIIFKDLDNFPDYGYPSSQHKDIRQSFIKSRERNAATARRIQLLDKYLSNNTVYVDDIAHFEINKNHSEWKKVNEVENEFRNLIAMRGLKYTYKRDTFWRTWRMVRYPGKDTVVYYRFDNSVNFTNYQNNGFWIIEEKSPLCPYELFSISEENKVCAVHLTKYYDHKNSCSSILSMSDLTGACDNPIVTEWRIERRFNSKVSERFPTVICGGRQSCTISTLYKIASTYISFRIVNVSNDVIYSRIMKEGKNYACVADCGKMDPYSKIISTKENSLRINLLGSKNKREDKLFFITKDVQHARNMLQTYQHNKNMNHRVNKNKYNSFKYRVKKNMFDFLMSSTAAPTCKALKLSHVQDEMDDDY